MHQQHSQCVMIPMRKRKFNWQDVETMTNTVIEQLKKSNYEPDVVLAISRGGLVPGMLIAIKTGAELAIISMRRYRQEYKPFKDINSNYHIATTRKFIKEDNILIVDDVHDEGITLGEVERFMQWALPRNRYKSAVLIYKKRKGLRKWGNTVPDYCGRVSAAWVIWPWETFGDIV